jgi:hypothetical protein
MNAPTRRALRARPPTTVARRQVEGFGSMRSASIGQAASGNAEATERDSSYDDVLRRVREEQEQVGQLISHPF